MSPIAHILAVCLSAAPQQKQPDVVGVLAVAPGTGPGPGLVDVNLKLRDELAKRLDGVLEAKDLQERMTGQPSNASLGELDRAYAAAVEAGKRDPARAVSWLRDIITELERQPPGAEAYDQWTRANLRLARLRLEYASSPEESEQGAAEARQLVERVLRLSPDLKVDPSFTPKRLVALVEEVRASLKKAPRYKLLVKSSVEQTRVFVDGKELGTAPVTASLPAGTYRIGGEKGALRAPIVLASVRDEDQAILLDFSLATVFRPNLGPGIVGADADDVKVIQAASTLGLDRVVATSIVERQKVTFLVASLVQVKPLATPLRQGWIRLGPGGVPPGGLPQLAEFLLTGQAKGDVVAARPPSLSQPGDKPATVTPAKADLSVKPPPQLGKPPLTAEPAKASPVLKWSPVATAGATVALGAFSVWQLSVSNGKYSDADALLGGGTLSPTDAALHDQLVSDGDAARKNAAIGAAGAGVALVSTAVLSYLSYHQSHEIGPFRF